MGPEEASIAEMVVAVDERAPEPPSLRVRHGLQARRECALFPSFVKAAADATVERDWIVAEASGGSAAVFFHANCGERGFAVPSARNPPAAYPVRMKPAARTVK